MKFGYARVSTDDQNPALQLAALRTGCKTIFKDEGISGATTKRPSLLRCLKAIQEGDTLIVWKLDRLGRSLHDLIVILDELRARGVKFHSFTEHIATETLTGSAMWQMIGVLAELERSTITERTRAGVKAARRRGVKFWRKSKMTPRQVAHARKLIEVGDDRAKVAALFKVGPEDSISGFEFSSLNAVHGSTARIRFLFPPQLIGGLQPTCTKTLRNLRHASRPVVSMAVATVTA